MKNQCVNKMSYHNNVLSIFFFSSRIQDEQNVLLFAQHFHIIKEKTL